MVQWLGLHAFTAEGMGPIAGRGNRFYKLRGRAKKEKKGILPFNLDWFVTGFDQQSTEEMVQCQFCASVSRVVSFYQLSEKPAIWLSWIAFMDETPCHTRKKDTL